MLPTAKRERGSAPRILRRDKLGHGAVLTFREIEKGKEKDAVFHLAKS